MTNQFTSEEIYLIKKLQNDPAILFIGQSYYKLDSDKDLFLTKFGEKYNYGQEVKTYSDMLNISENKDSVRSWSQKVFENISIPESINIISKFPWNHLVTSAIDNNLIRAFKNEVRAVQPVFTQGYKLTEPRSRTQLHQTFLFGQIQYSDIDKSSPLSKLEFLKRKQMASSLLERFPADIVTPKGVLVIDGWNPDEDWLSAEIFYPILSRFGRSQIHIFNSNNEMVDNLYLKDLYEDGKVVFYQESLSVFVERAMESEQLNVDKISSDESGLWLFFGEERIRVPNVIRNVISKSAILIGRTTFDTTKELSREQYVNEFREFISYSPTIPRWEDYALGLAFKRDFISEILNRLHHNTKFIPEVPMIIHGQASSGKTIGLGQVLFELATDEKFNSAFLYIERTYKRFDENSLKNIDEFCLWAEENGADKTIIVYDGMLNSESYYSILSNLTSRGRKVFLIGSSYLESHNKASNFIEVPIEFTQKEKISFESFIRRVVTDKPALSNIINSQNNKNFLSVLYHYLPESKSNINQLIRKEARHYSDNLKVQPVKKIEPDLIIKDLLKELGFQEELTPTFTSEEILIGKENEAVATHFINLVMVVGKLGLTIPFELLIRALGTQSLEADFFNLIPNTDLIRWFEDHNGNIDVGPRTKLEANIYCYSLGGVGAEIDYFKQALQVIRDSYHTTQEDKEVEFASQLLQQLKQSGTQYRRYIYEYADILSNLRMSRQAVHPRLMLQEASLLQEAVKEKGLLPKDKSPLEILDLAETVIREAISLDNSPKSPTYTYLKVELASIMGSKAVESKSNRHESKRLFEDAREEILSFSFSTQNYHALDILLWTIRDQAKITKDKIELAKLFAEAEHYLQFGAEEGIAIAFQEDFNKRRLEIGQVFENLHLSEEAFKELNQMGSKAGYFLQTKQLLGNVEIYSKANYSEGDLKRIDTALQYLSNHFLKVKFDSQCLYLLLKLWWLSKTLQPIFGSERTPLKFTHNDWIYLLEITSLLLENSNIYISPTAKYLKALAEFHTSNYIDSINTFRDLSEQTDRTNIGARRIKKYFVASNSDGSTKKYFGILQSDLDFRNSSAIIFVDGLSINIKCLYSDFRRSLRKGEAIDFAIAFNFIGPVAIPLNR